MEMMDQLFHMSVAWRQKNSCCRRMLKADTWTSLFLLMMLMRVCRGLSCHYTEYEISGECCPMCRPGNKVYKHCTEFTSTSCVPCTEGTYNEKSNGLTDCRPCSSCDPGFGLKVKLECTRSSDSVCEPLDGFFCEDFSSKNCLAAQKHSSCKGGQYIRQRGTASTDTDCSDCSTGTFSDGTGTSCQPHRQCEAENLQQIQAGTSSTDAQCGEQRLNVLAIVFGVLVAVVAIVAAAVVLWFYKKKRLETTNKKRDPSEPEDNTEMDPMKRLEPAADTP